MTKQESESRKQRNYEFAAWWNAATVGERENEVNRLVFGEDSMPRWRVWNPTTAIEDAMEVWDRMIERGFGWTLSHYPDDGCCDFPLWCRCRPARRGEVHAGDFVPQPTRELAICLAACLACLEDDK